MSSGAPSTGSGRAAQRPPQNVKDLFGRIAPWYDLLNHVLTLGIDVSWRKRLVRELPLPCPSTILDVACGTGDLAIELSRRGYRVLGTDFCSPMLRLFRRKSALPLFQADALRLPLPDGCVDGVTVAFGIRNFADPDAGLAELRRVLRPGGVLAVLEFGVPRSPWLRVPYLLYFRWLLPVLGRVVSGDAEAYRHLRDSVLAFPYGEAFVRMMVSAGLEPLRLAPLSGGISYLYLSRRPPL